MTKGSAYTRRQLRDRGLFNSYSIAKAAVNRVYIIYSNDTGRAGNGMRVQVIGIGFDTDPTGPWYDDKAKTFAFRRVTDKAAVVLAAQAWVALQDYGIAYTEWENDPFGGWHPKGSMKKAMQKETA